jgi:selenocysteine-specific elongation factor
LAKAIKEVSLAVAERPDIGNPRLSCDRVFSVHGSGLIVTGTVQHGMFKVGEEINIWPGMKTGRIRKIECFGESCSGAGPGSRAGINITGIDSADIRRGSLITRRDPPESDTVDIMVRMIPGEDLRKGDVRIYFETLSVLGRIVPLDDKATNEEGIPAQLILNDGVSAYIGERCILRDTSRHATVGGGVVLHHCASKICKADRDAVAERLRKMLPLYPRKVILEELAVRGALSTKDLPWTIFSDETMREEILSLVKEGVLFQSGERVFMAGIIEDAENQIKTYLKDTKKTIPVATLRSALRLDDEIFDDVLKALLSRKEIESDEMGIRRIGLTDDLAPEKAETAKKIINLLKESTGPVLLADILSKISGSKDTVYYLRNHGEIIELTDTFFIDENRFKDMKQFVIETIQTKGQLSIQDIAAEFSLSRRPAVAVLTKFDQLFITQRRDNVRVAGKAFCVEKKD